MSGPHRISIGVVLVVAAWGARSATAQMDPDVELLQLKVVDAEYSRALDRIVIASDLPSHRVRIVDPVTGTGLDVPLPLVPTCVSVSPDGLQAAVGHNAWISLVDLQTAAIVQTLNVSTNVLDVVLAGNGWVYAFPKVDQWQQIHCVNIATGQETLGSGLIYAGTLAKLHPGGGAMYGADNGLSPSDIEKYGISSGTAQILYDSPYHGDFAMCGDLWFSQDGLRIFTRCGNVFAAAELQQSDMLYSGSLSNLALIESLWHSSTADKIFVVPETPQFGGIGTDTKLNVYEDMFLVFQEAVDLPKLVVGPAQHDTHGRFVFVDDAASRVSILVRIDPSSGLALDAGLVTYALQPVVTALTAPLNELSLGSGGVQLLQLDAGRELAGKPYLMLGSAHGTVPGVPMGSVVVPLNFDRYFALTYLFPDSTPLVDASGLLSEQGQARVSFVLPAGSSPTLLGLTLNHAFIVMDGQAVFASNPVPLTFEL